jgi:hypothetical protein
LARRVEPLNPWAHPAPYDFPLRLFLILDSIQLPSALACLHKLDLPLTASVYTPELTQLARFSRIGSRDVGCDMALKSLEKSSTTCPSGQDKTMTRSRDG